MSGATGTATVMAQTIWEWEFALEILPDLAEGLITTVQATMTGAALALGLGLVLALLRRAHLKVVRWPIAFVIEFIRSTPLLVHLFFLFYALPHLGITLSPFMAGMIGLGVHYATYTSEVYRAGIEGVPNGQWEAAKALNLPRRRLWAGVVLPQAIKSVLPPLGNYVIAMFKETPLLAFITVVEVMRVAQSVGASTYRYLEPLTMVGILFFLIGYPFVLLLRRLEARLATP